ncbi:MAG: nickel pincer cofactor biosynthesis protein LarB [Eubacterium sp.]|nr:nickel pincer cofactor biosynthesis protein LarB [Eubacterium sp.]
MDKTELQSILQGVADGTISSEEAAVKIKTEPFEDLGFAKVDHHRGVRQGAAEVIYGAGKTDEQILHIAKAMLDNGEKSVLITRMSQSAYEYVSKEIPLFYDQLSKIGIAGEKITTDNGVGKIVIATGGTSDIPVAEEAALTAEFYGSNVMRLYDVGVSGVHRLMNSIDELVTARVIVAVAGMEGALASVVGGMVDCPVIAVPTSVGYGANFSGLSALLSMLNSCASGVSVVNIDNGFGAGYLANMINKI